MDQDLTQFRLETERLLLIPITMDYAEVIFDEFTPEVTFYMHPRSPHRIEETIHFIRESLIGLERGTNLQLVVLKKETLEFLGCTGLHDLSSRVPEFGIWLKQSAHGHGFGMEAIVALHHWAMEHLEFEYIKYPVDEENYASRRIPEALKGVIGREYQVMSLNNRRLFILEYRFYPEPNVAEKQFEQTE